MADSLGGRALVILGAPRGGTSAVANAFRLLGFYLGEDDDFPEPREGNPAGIFERREILAFNNRCVETLYLGHDRPDLVSMEDHPAFPRLVDEASALLRIQFKGRERWGWKEPITTLLAPIYQAALTRDGVVPGYILCVRRPSEVFASQKKIAEAGETHREAPIGARAYRRWMSYTLKSLQFSKGAPRAMVAYHELVSEPRATLEAAFRAVTGEGPDSGALEAACNSVRSDYYRNKARQDVPEDAPGPVHALWELCCRIALDPVGLKAGAYDEEIDRIEAEFAVLSNCFAEPEPPYGQVAFTGPGVKGSFGVPFRPSEGWTALDIEVSARAASDLFGTLYPLPANVYIRNARWGEEPVRIRAINDTAESSEGRSTRFSLGFSSPQVVVRTPAGVGPYRLRLEIFVELNIFTAFDALLWQTRKTRALEGQVGAANDQLCKLEEQAMRLRQEIDRLKSRA